MDPRELIEKLGMAPLSTEGGYFVETYRSEDSTAIYYLLTSDDISAMHRLKSDEVFHFYVGDPVEMLLLEPDGSSSVITLGGDVLSGESPQVVVPKGTWQGCRVKQGGRFALMGTTVAPAFNPEDYEHGSRNDLIAKYPHRADLIRQLTRGL